jgi:hypothetical protein
MKMAETPDFDQIARRIFIERTINVEMIADSLRQVWNARGAADIDKLDDELSDKMMVTAFTDMLRALDR